MLSYMPPKDLIALRTKQGTKLQVGDSLDFHQGEIAMEPHPIFGPIPVIRITEITADGRFAGGEFVCGECDTIVHVHPGDVFQKRRCSTCQRKHQSKAKRGVRTPEDEIRVSAEKEKKKAEREAKKAQTSYEAAIAKAKKAQTDAEKRLADLQEKAEEKRKLIENEAQRQGVEVSPNAVQA